MPGRNPVLKQGVENLITVVRQYIKQVHTLRARNELNEEIEARRIAYWHCAQTGDDLNKYVESVLQKLMQRVAAEIIVEQRKAQDLDARRALPPAEISKKKALNV